MHGVGRVKPLLECSPFLLWQLAVLVLFCLRCRRRLANGYETALSGEIDKKLNRLGRSQRMRKGQPLPPQVDVEVSRSRGQRVPYSLSQVASYLLTYVGIWRSRLSLATSRRKMTRATRHVAKGSARSSAGSPR